MERNDLSAADAMADADPLYRRSAQGRVTAFIARHTVVWELSFAFLALLSVALDYVFADASGEAAERVFIAQVACVLPRPACVK